MEQASAPAISQSPELKPEACQGTANQAKRSRGEWQKGTVAASPSGVFRSCLTNNRSCGHPASVWFGVFTASCSSCFLFFWLSLICPCRDAVWDISAQKKTNDSKSLHLCTTCQGMWGIYITLYRLHDTIIWKMNANGVINDFCIIVVIYLHILVGESVLLMGKYPDSLPPADMGVWCSASLLSVHDWNITAACFL